MALCTASATPVGDVDLDADERGGRKAVAVRG
jgi:hypothetical protein